MHVATVEKKGHGFERGQEGICGNIWREKRKERNVVTIISK